MKFKIGDYIRHPKYGVGIVLSVGEHTEVRFSIEEYGVKKFVTTFIEKKCALVDKNTLDSKEAEVSTAIQQKPLDVDGRVLSVLKNFQRFSLTEFGINELKDFFVFKLNYHQGHKRALRYHLLVQCDSEDEGQEFIKEIKKGLLRLGVLAKGGILETERNFEEEKQEKFPFETSMLGIHHCRGMEKDSVAIVSSSVRADIQLRRKNKDDSVKSAMKNQAKEKRLK